MLLFWLKCEGMSSAFDELRDVCMMVGASPSNCPTATSCSVKLCLTRVRFPKGIHCFSYFHNIYMVVDQNQMQLKSWFISFVSAFQYQIHLYSVIAIAWQLPSIPPFVALPAKFATLLSKYDYYVDVIYIKIVILERSHYRVKFTGFEAFCSKTTAINITTSTLFCSVILYLQAVNSLHRPFWLNSP